MIRWRGTNDGRDYEIVYTINRNAKDEGDVDRIRHFHCAVYDAYTNLFWIGAGDSTVEPHIWTIKPDGTGITLIGQGDGSFSQQWRTAFMFTKDYVYWWSDSNKEYCLMVVFV